MTFRVLVPVIAGTLAALPASAADAPDPLVPSTIGGAPAAFGIGETTVAHLYWRAAGRLHTISGPFPKAELVQIAESLARISG